jgi:hypothetical protein
MRALLCPRLLSLLLLVLLLPLLPPGVAAAESSFVGRQPVIATNGKIVGVAMGRDDGVYFARSVDGGRSFSEPIKVASPTKLMLGMRRGPRIAIAGSSIVITAIVGEQGNGADGDLVAWRSTDEGRTWSSAVRVNDVVASAREGLHDLAAGANGMLAVAWLDLRAKGTRIYTSTSTDGGRTWAANRLAYESPTGSVCECCHPSVAIAANGEVAIMFRNQIRATAGPASATATATATATGSDPAPVRDMYLVRSRRDGSFTSAAKLGRESWTLAACPMDGGDVAFDAKGEPIAIWRRDSDVFLTTSGEAEQRLDAGKNPVLAIARTGIYGAWTSGEGLIVQDLKTQQPVAMLPAARWPVLLASADGPTLLAYEQDGRSFVRVLDSVASSARR